MNWSKTKTIFIICFFLLDCFLGYQLILRQRSAQNQVSTYQQSSFTQYIKNKNIQINTNLPDSSQPVTFLSGSYLDFSNQKNLELQKELNTLAGSKSDPVQTFTITPGTMALKSTFQKKIPVPETQTDQQAFLTQYVYRGDSYQFWTYDKGTHIYKFIQTYNGDPVFSVSNGKINTLDLTLTKDGRYIKGYEQTYITIKPEQATKLGIQPMDAIQQLWEKNKLPVIEKPVIEQIELGYISLSENSDQSQTLAYLPVWYMDVKTNQGLKHYFVTGIYGKIQTIDGGE